MVEHSNFRKNTPAAQNSEIEIKNCKDFAEFLNFLPEIESHLCRGGYIQDRNGTPCCDGDVIRIIVPEGSGMTGRLCWSDTDKSFSIRNAYKRQIAYFVHNLVFEKVDEGIKK